MKKARTVSLLIEVSSYSTNSGFQSTVRAELRDWDLWGPLFICMSLAVMLSIEAHDDASLVFSVIFVIMWVGAAVVTINGQLLGGRLSFFQSVCLLGYCVFPILVSAAVCLAFNALLPSGLAVVLRFVAVVVALLWSILGTVLIRETIMFRIHCLHADTWIVRLY